MPFFRRTRADWRVGREVETSVWTHVLWGVALMVAVVLVGWLVWYVSRLPMFSIQTITVAGGDTVTHDEVRTHVEQVLSGSYVRIVPYTFSYLVPTEKIRSSLMSSSRINHVDVVRSSRNELKVSFDEYLPTALWCANADEQAECYFLDGEGYAFSIAPQLRGGSLVRHIVEDADRLEEKHMFELARYSRINDFIKALESELGLRVTHVVHSKNGDSTYHLSGGGDVITVTDVETEPALNNLKALLESEEYKHIEPGNFRYIDLRFGNKLFVNETFEVSTSTASTTGE